MTPREIRYVSQNHFCLQPHREQTPSSPHHINGSAATESEARVLTGETRGASITDRTKYNTP